MASGTKVGSLLIAVPTMGGIMKSPTAMTLVKLTRALLRDGIEIEIHNIDSADIVLARDMFANMLLHNTKWDALLFVDSDMDFRPELVKRMLALGVDVAGAAVVKRGLDLASFAAAMRNHGDHDRALAQSSTFNFKRSWDEKKTEPGRSRDGFHTMAAVGMGCVLISKAAFRKMADRKVAPRRRDLASSGKDACWSFFANIELNGTILTEDYSFCYRWTKQMKQDLWVCLDEPVGHVGAFTYSARYTALLGGNPPLTLAGALRRPTGKI